MPAPDSAPTTTATGFWRLERPAGLRRTWLIDPNGQAVFVLGVNTVMRDTLLDGGEPRCDGILGYIRRHEPTVAARIEWARLSTGYCAGETVPDPDVLWVMRQVGHADSKMTMDVYAQLQQRAEQSYGEAFDALVRQARERLYGAVENAAAEQDDGEGVERTLKDLVDKWREEPNGS